MDCYDIRWDGEDSTPDHPIPGVSTNPHYDPQRKSLGDIQLYAGKLDLASMTPLTDSTVCSTTFGLINPGKQYLVYQPDVNKNMTIQLPPGNYEIETCDSADSSTETSSIQWEGGEITIERPM